MARKLQRQIGTFIVLEKNSNRIIKGFFLIIISSLLTGCDGMLGSQTVPDILYLGWDENDRFQIYQQSFESESSQLTNSAEGIYDFALAPDGEQIVFTTFNEQDNSAIWKMALPSNETELLYECPDSLCSQPVWDPDGRRIIFQRQLISGSGALETSTLWWLDTDSGQVQSLFEDQEILGSAVRFSPDGDWISFFSPINEELQFYNFADGDSRFIANEVGMPVSWSPDSERVVYPNFNLVIIHGDEGEDHLEHTHDYQTATHLFVADLQTDEFHSLSAQFSVEDSVPSWSPTGQWIVFGRRPSRTGAGRQLWLVRPDGSDTTALTEDFNVNYGPPSWSTSGRYLLYQKYLLDDSQENPGIWIYDLETAEEHQLIQDGIQPQWLE